MDRSMVISLRERGSWRGHASNMARTPAGRTPPEPIVFLNFKTGGGWGDTSPGRVRAAARLQSKPRPPPPQS
jgi:hypothetical protein